MIRRNLMLEQAISPESFSKFVAELYERSDLPILQNSAYKPTVAALVVDIVNLWEQTKWQHLTMVDNCRLHPESNVFPNAMRGEKNAQTTF